MQKIMFNDKYGLTRAVLNGEKTMTRRVTKPISENVDKLIFGPLKNGRNELKNGRALYYVDGRIYIPKYKVGEVIAVAQSLRDMGYDPRDTRHKSGAIWGLDHTPAWTNKMFVSASECIHQIRITNVRLEHLKDISDEDCLREGIEKDGEVYSFNDYEGYKTPRNAFAELIDRVSGKGTWLYNPHVFVYEFELVK